MPYDRTKEGEFQRNETQEFEKIPARSRLAIPGLLVSLLNACTSQKDKKTSDGSSSTEEIESGDADTSGEGDGDQVDGEAIDGTEELLSPPVPQLVSVPTGLEVTWKAVSGAEKYKIWLSIEGSSELPDSFIETETTIHMFTDVKIGSSYSVWMSTVSGERESVISVPVTDTFTLTACEDMRRPQLDFSKFQKAPEEYTPTSKMYGDKSSALIAIQFEGHVESDQNALSHAGIATPDGQLLMVRRLGNSDFVNGIPKPIVFDNINLSENDQVVIYFILNGVSPHAIAIDIEFFSTHENKPVKDLNQPTLMPWNAAKNFHWNTPSNTLEDQSVIYPSLGGGERYLQTAQKGSDWVPGAQLAGLTILDIMGNPISSPYHLPDHDNWCVYDDTGTEFLRMIFRIG